MNYEAWGEFARPLFAHEPKLRELEEQLYGHVLEAIDWEALGWLEQCVFELLSRSDKIDDELALDLSAAVMDRALLRAADDPSRYGDWGPPMGVTEAEAKAVAFDDTCPFCVARRQTEEAAAANGRDAHGCNGDATSRTADDREDEPCPCCEELVRSWREQHREVLIKAGLWRAEGSS